MRLVPFVGDLSKSDARLLQRMATEARRVLEFGMGGSTQILAQCCRDVTSLDTSKKWIRRTRNILKQLPAHPARLLSYKQLGSLRGKFDMIFVDGHPLYRVEFARKVWPRLEIGGHLLVHDTRSRHISVVCDLLHGFQNEISEISVNRDGSNITVITKKDLEPYTNWNKDEDKEPWEIGNWPNKKRRLPKDWIRIRTRRLRG